MDKSEFETNIHIMRMTSPTIITDACKCEELSSDNIELFKDKLMWLCNLDKPDHTDEAIKNIRWITEIIIVIDVNLISKLNDNINHMSELTSSKSRMMQAYYLLNEKSEKHIAVNTEYMIGAMCHYLHSCDAKISDLKTFLNAKTAISRIYEICKNESNSTDNGGN